MSYTKLYQTNQKKKRNQNKKIWKQAAGHQFGQPPTQPAAQLFSLSNRYTTSR
jgi:hypothetical protein